MSGRKSLRAGHLKRRIQLRNGSWVRVIRAAFPIVKPKPDMPITALVERDDGKRWEMHYSEMMPGGSNAMEYYGWVGSGVVRGSRWMPLTWGMG